MKNIIFTVRLLAALVVSSPAFSQFYVVLDSRWYVFQNTTRAAEFYASGGVGLREIDLSGAGMTNCRESNGSPPTPVGLPVQVAVGFDDFVFATGFVNYSTLLPRRIVVRSFSGSLICNGQVPDPTISADIFRNGFER